MNDPLDIFLRLIFPWETQDLQLYKSVTWKFPKTNATDNRLPFANYATQSYPDLVRLIQSRASKPQQDVYVALGTQRMVDMTKLTKDGFPRAVRKIENIVSLKSIWLDVDVGKDKAYATQGDAVVALSDFMKKVGLPTPTMIVESGSGGFHVYWCTDTAMTQNDWRPLAHGLQAAALAYGLKFDPQVSVNSAGILRVPGTFNWKDPNFAKPVSLVQPANGSYPVYSYQQLTAALKNYIGSVQVGTPSGPVAVSSWGQNFTSGVSTAAPPVAIDDIAVNCAAVSDVLSRGGNRDPEPLWNMMMLIASFTEDPQDAAHRLSKGDSRYTAQETERKLLEKINARAANPNMGWPQCSTINPLHSACKTCPLFQNNKSPLNYAARPNSAPPGATPQTGTDPLVPPPYWRDNDGHVFVSIKSEEEGEPDRTFNVLDHPVLEAGFNPQDGHLIFKTNISGVDRWLDVNVSSSMQPTAMATSISANNGIFLHASKHKLARDFMVAWVTHLQKTKRQVSPATYGWTEDKLGFTFDKTTYFEHGPAVAFRGSTFDTRYQVHGELQPWKDAMQLVYGNTQLEAVVAASFGAPLVALMGTVSGILSIYSADSGIGKSTAMQLGQAVWGHPKNGMSSLDDTPNSVKKKISDLKSLPIYWDELITKDALEKVVDLVFSFTQGKSKSRLTRDAQQQETNAYTTLFVCASNYGLSSTVYSGTDGTEAGGLRLFEVEASKKPATVPPYQANNTMMQLEHNYGCAGAIYSDFIARNRQLVKKLLNAMSMKLDQKHTFDSKERFWNVTMTSIIMGAALANAAGLTTFDVAAMETMLDNELLRQRLSLGKKSHSTLSDPQAVLYLMNDMISEIRGKFMITTDIVPIGMGRPVGIQLIGTDVSRIENLWLQLGDTDGRIRCRAREFDTWMRKRNQNPDNIMRMLGQWYTIVEGKMTIGAGVPMLDVQSKGLTGRAHCYDLTPIPTSSGSIPGSP